MGPSTSTSKRPSHLLETLAQLQQEDTWEYQAMYALKSRFELSGWGYTEERLARTRQAYERAVALRPNGVEPLLSYAVFLRRIGDLEGAMALLTRAMRLDPLNPGVIGQYARVLSATEGLDAALEPLEYLRRLRPEDPQTHMKKAGILASFGRFDEAFEALVDSPYGDGNEVLQYHLRSVSLSMGNLEDAEFWLRRSPARPTEFALIPGLRGDWDAAFSAIEIALQNMRAPIDADNERAGDVSYLTGRYQAARYYYQASATELRPGAWRLTKQNYRRGLKLAAAMLQLGEREDALDLLDALESWLAGHYALGYEGYEGYATTRAELLALRGDRRGAVAELRALFDSGWRQLSGPWSNTWYGRESPCFAGLATSSEFLALRRESEQALAEQRARSTRHAADGLSGNGGLQTVAGFLAFQGRAGEGR